MESLRIHLASVPPALLSRKMSLSDDPRRRGKPCSPARTSRPNGRKLVQEQHPRLRNVRSAAATESRHRPPTRPRRRPPPEQGTPYDCPLPAPLPARTPARGLSRLRSRSLRPRARGRSRPSCRFGWCRGRSGVRARGFRREGRLPVRAAVWVARAARRRRSGCGSGCRCRGRPRRCSRPRARRDGAGNRAGRGCRGSSRRRAPSARRWWACRWRRLSQPGKQHVWSSRASSSRRNAGGTVRRLRPTLKREAVALDLRHDVGVAAEPAGSLGEISGPSSSSERPRPSAHSAAASTWTTTRARSRRGSSAAASDASARSSSASTRAGRGRVDASAVRVPASRLRLRVARRCCALRAATLEHALARRFQRPDQQRAVLGREPRPQEQRAVVVEEVVDVLQLVRLRERPPPQPGERPAAPAPAAMPSAPPRARAGPPPMTRSRPWSAPEPCVNVSSPRPNAARVAGSSCNASATRMNSRASRPVIPQRHARKRCRSLLSPCSRISHTSSSQRAVAALRCADRLASSSTRCSVAASRATTPSRTLSIQRCLHREKSTDPIGRKRIGPARVRTVRPGMRLKLWA